MFQSYEKKLKLRFEVRSIWRFHNNFWSH